jgi:hypothetical protein
MYYTLNIMENVFKIVIDLLSVIRALLPFLKRGMTVACFHTVGDFPCNKLILKMWLKRGTKVSEQPSLIKLGISYGPTHFAGLRRRTACLTSESEIEGTFKKSEKVKWALFGIATEEGELKIKEKWAAEASTIHWGCVITFSPILSWLTTWSFFLNAETYFEKYLCLVYRLSSIDFNQRSLSVLMVVLTS